MRDVKPERSMGDEYLNGVLRSVNVRREGQGVGGGEGSDESVGGGDELGSQGQSVKNPGSAQDTSNSFSMGASPTILFKAPILPNDFSNLNTNLSHLLICCTIYQTAIWPQCTPLFDSRPSRSRLLMPRGGEAHPSLR